MEVEQFEALLRRFLRREPFEPFVVELVDGTVVAIDEPSVVIGGGGATYFGPHYELIEFDCNEVRTMRPIVREAAS